jgi:hypothetical protein
VAPGSGSLPRVRGIRCVAPGSGLHRQQSGGVIQDGPVAQGGQARQLPQFALQPAPHAQADVGGKLLEGLLHLRGDDDLVHHGCCLMRATAHRDSASPLERGRGGPEQRVCRKLDDWRASQTGPSSPSGKRGPGPGPGRGGLRWPAGNPVGLTACRMPGFENSSATGTCWFSPPCPGGGPGLRWPAPQRVSGVWHRVRHRVRSREGVPGAAAELQFLQDTVCRKFRCRRRAPRACRSCNGHLPRELRGLAAPRRPGGPWHASGSAPGTHCPCCPPGARKATPVDARALPT